MKRGCGLALVGSLVLLVGLAWVWLQRTNPARADALFSTLELPSAWRYVHTDFSGDLIFPGGETRFYFAKTTPEEAAADGRRMLEAAGLTISIPSGMPDPCSSNHAPGNHTLCFVDVRLPNQSLYLVVMDRIGAGFYDEEPWFIGSASDEMLVRIIIGY